MRLPRWPSPAPKARPAPRAVVSALLLPLRRQHQRLLRPALRLRRRPKSKVSSPGSRACSASETRQRQPPWQRRPPQQPLTPLHVVNRAVMAAMVKAVAAVVDATEIAKVAGTAIVMAAATHPAMAAAMPTVRAVAAVANVPPKVVLPAMQKAVHNVTQSAAPKAKAANRANPVKAAMAVTVAAAAVMQSHATWPLA